MKKYLILFSVIALVVAGLFLVPVSAHDGSPTPNSTEFGHHVASMAPEHPQMHGAMFGNMVSSMAQGESCPHH